MQRLNEYLRILKPIVSRDISKAIGRSHHSERDRMLAIGTRVPQSRHRDQRRCRQKGGGDNSGGKTFTVFSPVFFPRSLTWSGIERNATTLVEKVELMPVLCTKALPSKPGIQNGPLVLFLHAEYFSKVPETHQKKWSRQKASRNLDFSLWGWESRRLHFAKIWWKYYLMFVGYQTLVSH